MITREKNENNSLELKVKISADVWAKALEEAYESTKGKYSIQGFRKGKAPRKVIEKTYGDTVFYDEAFDTIVSKEYNEFLANNTDLQPIDYPKVSINSITENGVEATIVVDLMPNVKLGKYEGIKISKKVQEIKDKDIENEVEKLLGSSARFVESEAEASLGDFATIDFSGSVDGVKFEGGTANDFRLELGSHSFIDNFEEQIVGMKKGDEKDITVKFPEKYPAKELAGKDAVFAIKLNKLEKKELPQLTDKFISDTTEFETIEEYKKDVREKLILSANKNAERIAEADLVKAIVDSSEIELPQSMVNHEVEHIIEDLKNQLAYSQITIEQYLEFMKLTLDEFKKSKEGEAKNSLKTRLVLQEIIKQNNLLVTKEEFEAKLEEFAKSSGKSVAEFSKEISNYEKSYIENDILMSKLFKFLKEKNEII